MAVMALGATSCKMVWFPLYRVETPLQ